MKNPAGLMLLFALFWSAITIGFDTFIVRALLGQQRSLRLAPTFGRILSSVITTSSDRDGSLNYGANVHYEYQVAGRRYESGQVRFGQTSDSGGTWARETVRDNPASATRTVFYNPVDPAEAVLQPGIGGRELLLALFLSPFNAAMIGLWCATVVAFRGTPPQGGAIIEPAAGELRVRFPGFGPAASALGSFGLVCFIAIFALVLPFGFSPPPALVLAAWGLAALAAVGCFVWQRRNTAPDLIVSLERSTLTRLTAPRPATVTIVGWRDWRKSRPSHVIVPLERIRSVEVREEISDRGDSRSSTYYVAVVVGSEDGATSRNVELAAWTFQNRANAFAAWLRTTLGFPA